MQQARTPIRYSNNGTKKRHSASRSRNEETEIVRALVGAGGNPNLRLDQWDEETPLTIAIDEGYTEIIKILTGMSDS